jgi:hypothetical protein
MRSYHRLIAAVLVFSAGAFARPAFSATAFAGIDALQSTVMQKGQSSFSGLGVRARMTSARLVPGFDFLPSIEYWRSKTTVSAFGIETSRRDATLGVDARYTFKREGWSPYAGLGYGVHFISNKVNAPTLGLTDEEDSLVKGGISFLGGVNFPLTERIDNLLDLKYHVLSDYGQYKFSWGLAFDF